MADTPRKNFIDRVANRIGLLLVGLFALAAIFTDTISTYDHIDQTRNEPAAPISRIRMIDAEGNFHLRPFIYRSTIKDPITREYEEEFGTRYPLIFFPSGYSYKLFGLFETDIHLVGVSPIGENAPRLRLLGTDALGRDNFSRLIHSIRFSLGVTLFGSLAAFLLGVIIGSISGYSNRFLDTLLMGITDGMLSLPALIIILAARAAFPLELSSLLAALMLVSIFALVGWAEIARLTRGLVVAAREREYVVAAKATGVTQLRILFRHILPNIAGPLIIQAMLLLPTFLIAETALSYLGVGIQEPEPSLGNMLSGAADLTLLKSRPFEMLAPAFVIFLFILGIRLSTRKENDL